jgi:DNA-binding MarR family transcriptional regulator
MERMKFDGPSENNRRARFYRLTRAGRKLLETEKHDWEQTAAIREQYHAEEGLPCWNV